MNQKEFEERLDGYADRLSAAVSDGVKKLEETVDTARENLRTESAEARGGWTREQRRGALLIAAGGAWLLYTIGIFDEPIFPVLLIILGVYLFARGRSARPEDTAPPVSRDDADPTP